MTVRCGAANDGQAEETRAKVSAAPAAARESRGRAGRGKVTNGSQKLCGGYSSGSRSLTQSSCSCPNGPAKGGPTFSLQTSPISRPVSQIGRLIVTNHD
jgi:hypothetical protein